MTRAVRSTSIRLRRRRFGLLLGLSLLFLLLVTSVALAHEPRLPERGATLETATLVDEPATSWVYYGEIEKPGEVWYYRLEFSAGDRIYLQVITPERDAFAPSAALMGPGLVPEGQPPASVQVPDNAHAVVQEGARGEAEYEPFTPGAYFYPAIIDMAAPQDGTYYAAVFAGEASGAFGLAVGYEERFTAPGWVRLPADLLVIYAWDGGWAIALAPGIAVLVIGASCLWWRHRRTKRGRSLSGWLAAAAGLMYLTTAVTILVQLFRAAAVTGIDAAMGVTAGFIVASIVMGALLIWLGWRDRASAPAGSAPGPTILSRVTLFILCLAGLGLLSGYFLGPALALAAAVAPPYRRTAQ
jgi:hypothetical protein